jgi:hypothetical protein
LHALLRAAFREIPDHRQNGTTIPLVDALMSAFAMFSLKDPSLLAFDERRHDRNLQNLYGIEHVPSDTRMREILDPLDPEQLRGVYGDVFRELQRGKALQRLVFLDGCYLLLLDGTGYFSSQAIHWDNLRSHFRHFIFQSMKHLYEVILRGPVKELPAPPIFDTF